jgi:hypothetical protein
MTDRRTAGPLPVDPRAERERVLAELRERIRSRLEPVIGHLPRAEVDRLIDHIANFKYRHDGESALRSTPARGNHIDQ